MGPTFVPALRQLGWTHSLLITLILENGALTIPASPWDIPKAHPSFWRAQIPAGNSTEDEQLHGSGVTSKQNTSSAFPQRFPTPRGFVSPNCHHSLLERSRHRALCPSPVSLSGLGAVPLTSCSSGSHSTSHPPVTGLGSAFPWKITTFHVQIIPLAAGEGWGLIAEPQPCWFLVFSSFFTVSGPSGTPLIPEVAASWHTEYSQLNCPDP